MSASFLLALGLQSFYYSRQHYYSQNPPPPPQTQPPAPAPSPSPAPAPAPAPAQQERCNNTNFNASLFQPYKDSPTTCRTIRTKIRNQELPSLPTSKIDNQAMCIAWHCKGMCNNNCGRKVDHVAYTAAEYAPLVTWCQSHFPTQ